MLRCVMGKQKKKKNEKKKTQLLRKSALSEPKLFSDLVT